MSFSEKYLKPHPIFEDKTFEEFCLKIPKFYFKKDVPEDVIKNFEVVEKLLAHSYYEYKFIDEAYAKAIHTFEMAMSIRFREFFPDSKKHYFNNLIIELSKLNLFDTNLETLELVKEMRNYYSHPKRHSFAGFAIWKNIEFLNSLVNEMYEDVSLRLDRKRLMTEFDNQLENASLNKSLVMEIEGKQTILFSIQLLFINNKQSPITCLLAGVPPFNIEGEDNPITVPFVFKSKLSNPTFTDGILTGESFSAKKKVSFSAISNHPNLLPIFENWNSKYMKNENRSVYEGGIRHEASKLFVAEMQEFQKME